MGIVLSGGTIVTAADYYQADLRMEGEQITAIGHGIRQGSDQVLTVEGCFLFPGGIDPHTHFDLPVGQTVTADDFASGTKAALLGGTTTIIDFATQFKGETLALALANWHAKAGGKSYTDYGFHMAITEWNDRIAREMDRLVQEEGVSSFKFYLAYKNLLQVDDGVLLEALGRSKENGALICLHCENGDLVQRLVKDALAQGNRAPFHHALTRPSVAEREATARAISLAEAAQAPLYIVHLTCREALQGVVDAKVRGVEVFGETCPQYLLLDSSLYQGEGFEGAKYVMSPPLRSPHDQEALWHGLRAGVLDTVATDHCSFNYRGQKELGLEDFSKIPNGIPGVEHRMGLLYTYGVASGKIGINQFVALTATKPAQLFGLFPRKGTIAVGSDADIVVWDPWATSVITAPTQHQRVDYTPYEGFRQIGTAVHVFLRGRQVVCAGKISEEGPGGVYLHRKPFGKRG
ncbi:dihydropyrimidinase [Candidatus Formimonas warabiya]|uniref:Dihydropyrimidinase n=1 Tax=Formimonas warabiya TaxID=1761012 RepID=A0A3G1KQT6_FORW1|nr:dihydropyrimidinase [Candidatus Formimonas warabiya]ATW24839.1 dihydropyrimidinase [Candidatus Formimonas warabiya]